MLPETNRSQDHDRPKKAYQAPRLRTYGDIRDITRAVGKNGKLDNNNRKPFKTAI